MPRLNEATGHLPTPLAAVDLAAYDRNAADLERRAGSKPLRVATKSIRCRALVRRVLDRPQWTSALAYTLPEALWLTADDEGFYRDVLVGYPTADGDALRTLAADPDRASRVTVSVDCVEHLDLIEAATKSLPQGSAARVRVSLDLDASWRLARERVHLGMRRSPLHSTADLRALAEEVARRPALHLAGVMCYEGQIAGLPDHAGGPVRSRAVQLFQSLSARELAERRAEAISAVRQVADLEFVNGGGTGSLERTSQEDAVTDVAAGSGLMGPALFDGFTSFTPAPAAYFALSVVRRPSPAHATVLGGGWIASGPAGDDRLPTPAWPEGLQLLKAEGAGEVQTPLTGPGARDLAVGDRVWFRHAKSGEVCEHVNELQLVGPDGGLTAAETYRGEGQTFL